MREPRPLMIDSGINVKDCKHLEYGNPSSHTYGSSFLYITTVYLLAKHFIIRYKLKNWFVPLMLLLNLTFFGIYVIGFSRVYKGVHTYNQVLSGLMQGTILALIQAFVLYEDYFIFYLSIKTRKVHQLVINWFTMLTLALVVIGTMVHIHTLDTFKVPQQWKDNVMANCAGKDIDRLTLESPEQANFQKFYLGFSILGLYLGVIFEQKFMGTVEYVAFNDTDFITTVKRLILCQIPLVPCALPMLLVKKTSSYWMVIVFRTFLTPFMCFFVQYAFTKYIAIQFGLANTRKGDVRDTLVYMIPLTKTKTEENQAPAEATQPKKKKN